MFDDRDSENENFLKRSSSTFKIESNSSFLAADDSYDDEDADRSHSENENIPKRTFSIFLDINKITKQRKLNQSKRQ